MDADVCGPPKAWRYNPFGISLNSAGIHGIYCNSACEINSDRLDGVLSTVIWFSVDAVRVSAAVCCGHIRSVPHERNQTRIGTLWAAVWLEVQNILCHQHFSERIYSFFYEVILNTYSSIHSHIPICCSFFTLIHTSIPLPCLYCLIKSVFGFRPCMQRTNHWWDTKTELMTWDCSESRLHCRLRCNNRMLEMEAKQPCRHQSRFWIFESSQSLWGWVDIIYEEEMQ